MTRALIDFIDAEGRPVTLVEIYDRFPMANRNSLRQTLRRAADRGDVTKPCEGHYGPADRA